MDKTKETIMKSFVSKHKDVFEIIDRRWNIQLHHPLHAVVHFLNAEFYDNPQMQFDSEVIRRLCTCINKFVGNLQVEQKIMLKLHTSKIVGDIVILMRKTVSRVANKSYTTFKLLFFKPVASILFNTFSLAL